MIIDHPSLIGINQYVVLIYPDALGASMAFEKLLPPVKKERCTVNMYGIRHREYNHTWQRLLPDESYR